MFNIALLLGVALSLGLPLLSWRPACIPGVGLLLQFLPFCLLQLLLCRNLHSRLLCLLPLLLTGPLALLGLFWILRSKHLPALFAMLGDIALSHGFLPLWGFMLGTAFAIASKSLLVFWGTLLFTVIFPAAGGSLLGWALWGLGQVL